MTITFGSYDPVPSLSHLCNATCAGGDSAAFLTGLLLLLDRPPDPKLWQTRMYSGGKICSANPRTLFMGIVLLQHWRRDLKNVMKTRAPSSHLCGVLSIGRSPSACSVCCEFIVGYIHVNKPLKVLVPGWPLMNNRWCCGASYPGAAWAAVTL